MNPFFAVMVALFVCVVMGVSLHALVMAAQRIAKSFESIAASLAKAVDDLVKE